MNTAQPGQAQQDLTVPEGRDAALEQFVQLVEQKLLGELRLLQQHEHKFHVSYSNWQSDRANPQTRAQLVQSLCSIVDLGRQLSHFGGELADLQEDLGIECTVPDALSALEAKTGVETCESAPLHSPLSQEFENGA
ncbi:MAG: hypothetical protein H7Y22_03575 [Gemmatimonadaceae bacterium]|nr:hypothetical protein [Gloeobacterales cyanobacterium ES-bin-141]